MQARMLWVLTALVWYTVIWLAHRAALGEVVAVSDTAFRWVYGTVFFVFGVVLLGAVSRWWRAGSPALWRPAMLSLGSLAAAAELVSLAQPGTELALDLWMTALLGLIAAAILARVLPEHLNRAWLGIERREHDQGA